MPMASPSASVNLLFGYGTMWCAVSLRSRVGSLLPVGPEEGGKGCGCCSSSEGNVAAPGSPIESGIEMPHAAARFSSMCRVARLLRAPARRPFEAGAAQLAAHAAAAAAADDVVAAGPAEAGAEAEEAVDGSEGVSVGVTERLQKRERALLPSVPAASCMLTAPGASVRLFCCGELSLEVRLFSRARGAWLCETGHIDPHSDLRMSLLE